MPSMQHNFDVQEMSCQHCVKAVTAAVHGIDPAAAVEVDLAAGRVRVQTGQPDSAILAAIEDAGYPASSASAS